MKKSVTIKSSPHGLKLRLDPAASFEQILTDTKEQFEDTRAFFGNAKVALSFEGRSFSELEENALIDAIEHHSDIQIRCIMENNEQQDHMYVKALDNIGVLTLNGYFDIRHFKVLQDKLGNGDEIESGEHVLVMGDVPKGAKICSHGNVIVLGRIEGEVLAGAYSETPAFVYGLEIDSDEISVNDRKYVMQRGFFVSWKKLNHSRILRLNGDTVISEAASDAVTSFHQWFGSRSIKEEVSYTDD